jgi:hypothetical protein
VGDTTTSAIGDNATLMAQNVTPQGDPSKDEALRQVNAMPLDLPPPDTKRWVPRRKAVIVNAVRRGAISLEEVCRRYQLSVEEFAAWQSAIENHGVPGLRVTRLQIYRDARRRTTGSWRKAAPPAGIGNFQ